MTNATQSPAGVPSTTPSSEAKSDQSPSSDLAKLETRIRPSVIWVTVFDPKGNLLWTQSGFFISPDGRLRNQCRRKNGRRRNLQCQWDSCGFESIGSGGSTGRRKAAKTSAVSRATQRRRSNGRHRRCGGRQRTNGDVIGVVTSAGEKTIARSSAALDSLLSRISADTQAHWPATAETRATPGPTPKPRLIYAPAPAFPPQASRPGLSGTGRFRLTFDANGNVTNVQIVQSTGNQLFDEAAIKTLRQWKSAPSQGWQATVPVTFQTR